MKKALSILLVALATCVAPAQKDLTDTPKYECCAPFKIGVVYHNSRIEGSAILSSPQWDPTKPLPVRLDEVERVARRELSKLVKDEAVWKVDSFIIKRAPGTQNWFYHVYFFPTPRTTNFDYATFFVNFDGNPGVTDPATK